MDFTECYVDTVSSVAAAARSGCRARVRRLIERGCSVDCRDNRGWTALHEAAARGSADCARDILSAVRVRKGSQCLFLSADICVPDLLHCDILTPLS